jgi:predicted Zn-dependent protease with MMP-like domain
VSDGAEVDLDAILDLAEDALDRGDPKGALTYCDQALEVDPAHPGALFLSGEAYFELRELDEAEARFRRVLQEEPDHAASWAGLAGALFEQLRFDEAWNASLRATRLDPRDPEGWWWRGLLRERRGDLPGADRALRRASLLDDRRFPWPIPLTDAMIEAVVEQSLRDMHPSIRTYLQQIPILLEEVPSDDVLFDFEEPPSPAELLGFFSGYSLADRSIDNPWSNLPAAIVLFRRNLERYATDRDHLIEELRVTVLHEVGHFLGLDEDDLERRGLD